MIVALSRACGVFTTIFRLLKYQKENSKTTWETAVTVPYLFLFGPTPTSTCLGSGSSSWSENDDLGRTTCCNQSVVLLNVCLGLPLVLYVCLKVFALFSWFV